MLPQKKNPPAESDGDLAARPRSFVDPKIIVGGDHRRPGQLRRENALRKLEVQKEENRRILAAIEDSEREKNSCGRSGSIQPSLID
jgi:hypothetical protein